MVIDCYETKKINKTIEILQKNDITRIDFFCWTHPHEDHSKGIKKLVEYFKEETIILLPSELTARNINMETKEIYEELTSLNRNNRKKSGTLMVTSDEKPILNKKFLGTNNEVLDIKVIALAPISKNIINQTKNIETNYNDYSIMLLVEIDKHRLLFTGDIENSTINYIEEHYDSIDNVDYLKLPHHCSTTSNNIFNIIDCDINNIVCTTTINKKNNLPCKELYKDYSEKFKNMFCTSNSYFDDTTTEETGVFETKYYLNKNKYENAVIYN